MKNRNRTKRGPGVLVTDYAPLIVSCFALAVSVITALFTFVLQLDDLRVVVGSRPQVYVDGGKIIIRGRQELTLINSGTRAVALNSLEAVAFRLRSPDDDYRECVRPESADQQSIEDNATDEDTDKNDSPRPRPRTDYNIPLSFSPVVLKPGDIAVVSATPTERYLWRARPQGGIEIPTGWYQPQQDDVFLVCVFLDFVTPDSVTTRWNKPLFLVPIDPDLGARIEKEELFDKERPLPILKRVSPVWHRYFRD